MVPVLSGHGAACTTLRLGGAATARSFAHRAPSLNRQATNQGTGLADPTEAEVKGGDLARDLFTLEDISVQRDLHCRSEHIDADTSFVATTPVVAALAGSDWVVIKPGEQGIL